MGQAERKSMNYLEARCVALAKGIGAQGVQNGGIDGASITASVPGGVRELIAENLMGHAARARVLQRKRLAGVRVDDAANQPDLAGAVVGVGFHLLGFGSVVAYDNMFGPSNFNAADLDDYLVMQRDWGVDGGLRSVDPTTLEAMRRQAAEATRAVFEYLGLADFDDDHVEAVVGAEGSKDLPATDGVKVLSAARMIEQSGLTVLDIVAALAETGFTDIAERVLGMAKARVTGDYLQTAAIFDEQMNVLSALQDPNDYRGPGTGYRPTAERQAQIDAVRQARSVTDLVKEQATFADPDRLVVRGPASVGDDPREVVIGVSPAFGVKLFRTLSGMVVYDALEQILAGLEEEQCVPRLVRIADSVDLGVIGKSAARLSGSGIGVGLQAKGTTLIHRRDLPPLANLELLSVAPLITPEMYRLIGINAGRHAKGTTPAPMRNAYTDEAITARYHTRVVSMVAIERSESGSRRSRRQHGIGAQAMTVTAHSGRNLAEVTVEAARNGDLALDDIRVSRETLLAQADIAERSGSPQLAMNLRRAAEMTALSSEEMLAAYEALRPHRSSFAELEELAQRLAERDAPTCAALVREAATAYQRRGLLR